MTETADLGAMLDRVAAKARTLAGLAGLELVVSIDPGLGALNGDVQQLEAALVRLLLDALTLTPRGGRVAFTAAPDASGGIGIELGDATAKAAGEPEGLSIAGRFVELTCGAAMAMSVKRAQQMLAREYGTVGLARAPRGGERVLVWLPADRISPKAA